MVLHNEPIPFGTVASRPGLVIVAGMNGARRYNSQICAVARSKDFQIIRFKLRPHFQNHGGVAPIGRFNSMVACAHCWSAARGRFVPNSRQVA